MSHIYHPELEQRLKSAEGSGVGVLVDGCESCERHATDPVASLDDDHIKALWREMVRVERHRGVYRSRADARACDVLYRIAVFIERHGRDGSPWDYFSEEIPA